MSNQDYGDSNNSIENKGDQSNGCPNPITWVRKIKTPPSWEITEEKVLLPCMRKFCRECGPRLYNRQVFHFTSELASDIGRLKFLTLTLDPKVAPEASEKVWVEILKKIWAKYRKRLNGRARRRGEELRYMYAVEFTEDGVPHLHVVLSTSQEMEVLKDLWFSCGGGLVCDVKEIEDQDHLANAVAYALKDSFYGEDNEWTGYMRSVGASEGLGYYSESNTASKKEASKAGVPAVSSRGEYVNWLRDVLRPGEDQKVELKDGRVGTLLGVSGGRAEVLVNGDTVTCEALGVLPLDCRPPVVEEWECGMEDSGMRQTGIDLSRVDISSLELENRTRTFRYADDKGRWVTVTYDPETETREEAPSRPRT